MKDSVIMILFAIVILMFIANSRLGKAKVPKIKNLRASQVWGNTFFDTKKWLKWILIFLLKLAAEIVFGLWRLIASGIQMGTPSFFKKITNGL